MQTFKPSPHFKNSSLYPETSEMLWFPFAALSTGPLLQAETIVEITNRVCERYLNIRSEHQLDRRVVPSPSSHEPLRIAS